jgi:hypothetical protein
MRYYVLITLEGEIEADSIRDAEQKSLLNMDELDVTDNDVFELNED